MSTIKLNGSSEIEQAQRKVLNNEIEKIHGLLLSPLMNIKPIECGLRATLDAYNGEDQLATMGYVRHNTRLGITKAGFMREASEGIMKKMDEVPAQLREIEHLKTVLSNNQHELQEKQQEFRDFRATIAQEIPPDLVVRNWNMPERDFVRKVQELIEQ